MPKRTAGTSSFRQEVLNVVLAQLLAERGLFAAPEVLLPGAAIDVLVSFRGLRLAIEGEVEDQPNSANRAWRKAQDRIDVGIAQLGLAVVYPSALRHESISDLPKRMAESTLRFSICKRIAPVEPIWHQGNVEFLRTVLEEVFSHLSSEDEIRAAAGLMGSCVAGFATAMLAWEVSLHRVSEPLGIPTEASQERPAETAKIAALVVVNAILFQEELAKVDHRVPTVRACLEARSPHEAFLRAWRFILKEINYHAVFEVGTRILAELPADRRLDDTLRSAAEVILEVARMQVALEHDVAGRLYHLLLGDIAKPLGTYYTSVSAAILLLRLALNPELWNIDWRDKNEIGNFKLADLACGTGTLLAAAVQTLVDNFLRAVVGSLKLEQISSDRKDVLKQLLEEGVWGLDVLTSAVHLTATTLALPIPEVMTRGMRLYVLNLGVSRGRARLGSLDLLRDLPVTASLTMFPRATEARGRRATSRASAGRVRLELPQLDLICMNPPFTRTCGDNLLFGSLPATERRQLQSGLADLVRKKKLDASLTAGLGSVFLALADRYLRSGGRLAFVLQKALLSGIEWDSSRDLLAAGYFLEFIISSHDPRRWNFSENTDLSEVLVIAQKNSEDTPHRTTTCVNLWINDDSPVAALETAEQVRREKPPDLGSGVLTLRVGGRKIGEAFGVPWGDIRRAPNWLLPVAFAQNELVRRVFRFVHPPHHIQIGGADVELPLCPLGYLATIGPDRRRLWATFEVGDAPPGYPAFWGHDANEVSTLCQSPNAVLTKLDVPKETQRSNYAEELWAQSGNILIAERMWLNTQRLTALLLSEPVLSNVWWPVRLHSELTESASKALVLWLNSTPGLLLLLAARAETRGAWVDFKKPTLQNLPVLNLSTLSSPQLQELSLVFDELGEEVVQPLSQIGNDRVRAAIDDAISGSLRLPNFAELREMLALEPILTLHRFEQRLL